MIKLKIAIWEEPTAQSRVIAGLCPYPPMSYLRLAPNPKFQPHPRWIRRMGMELEFHSWWGLEGLVFLGSIILWEAQKTPKSVSRLGLCWGRSLCQKVALALHGAVSAAAASQSSPGSGFWVFQEHQDSFSHTWNILEFKARPAPAVQSRQSGFLTCKCTEKPLFKKFTFIFI